MTKTLKLRATKHPVPYPRRSDKFLGAKEFVEVPNNYYWRARRNRGEAETPEMAAAREAAPAKSKSKEADK